MLEVMSNRIAFEEHEGGISILKESKVIIGHPFFDVPPRKFQT